MTVAASPGIFGFGAQPAKGTIATTWYRHHATRLSIGSQQVIQQFPPELGGGFHPTGAFKMMAFGGGVATMHPRLDNIIGWLLYATVGQLSQSFSATPESGMYRHRFAPVANPLSMKWMSLRRYIPGADAGDELGEVVKDARATGLQIGLGAGQIAGVTFAAVGREPKLMEEIDSGDTYAWAWGNDLERYPSVPLAHQGSLEVDGEDPKATQLQVSIANAYTTPQEELIIGSPYPDDFILQQQTLTATYVYKWENHDLYQAIFSGTNVADGSGYIAWAPAVKTGSFDLIIQSPGNATGKSFPWRLRVYAPEMTWQTDGPIELVAGGWLSQRYIGVAQAQTSIPTFYVELDNLTSTYTWPTP